MQGEAVEQHRAMMPSAPATFALDDASDSEAAVEEFYSTSQPLSSSTSASVPQFDVESAPEFSSSLPKVLDPSRYNLYFHITHRDVLTRISRACLPLTPLLAPAPSPAPPDDLPSDDVASDDLEAAQLDSMGASVPLSTEPDLYGLIWLPATLILTATIATTTLRPHRTPFVTLLHTSTITAAYLLLAPAVTSLHRPSTHTLPRLLCVYGYSTAPLIPGLFLEPFVATTLPRAPAIFPAGIIVVAAVLSAWCIVRNVWLPKAPDRPMWPVVVAVCAHFAYVSLLLWRLS